ncbi:MAG TPA: hypothetical protein VFY96_01785 [Candidatus Binatia bacterium]|jgi:hypothetical protein|nr:hypothetical protein [Candidatus Binatia bacterium]
MLHEADVDKVAIEAASNSDDIRTTVYLSNVPNRDAGVALAKKVHAEALNRISFWHELGIEDAAPTGHQFTPINSAAGIL